MQHHDPATCDSFDKHLTIRVSCKLTFLHNDDRVLMVHGTEEVTLQHCSSLGLCRAVVNWTLNILNRKVNNILSSRIRTVYLRDL
jgi:hypothetical protein